MKNSTLVWHRFPGKGTRFGFVFFPGQSKFVGVFPDSIYSDSKDSDFENTACEELVYAFQSWAGEKWRGSLSQLDAFNVEVERLGFEARDFVREEIGESQNRAEVRAHASKVPAEAKPSVERKTENVEPVRFRRNTRRFQRGWKTLLSPSICEE